MKIKQTAAVSTTTPSAALALGTPAGQNENGFNLGGSVVAIIAANTVGFVGTAKWQYSLDGSTGWTDVGSAWTPTAAGATNIQSLEVKGPYMRLNATVVTAGNVIGTLISDV